MSPFHSFLVRAIESQVSTFTPSPETKARVEEAERYLGRPLPRDYRAFLEEVGHIPWPIEIGNLLDFKRNDWPPGFVAFGKDDNEAYGFLLAPERERIAKENSELVAARKRDEAYEESDERRAIDLVDRLVAEKLLEVEPPFDDERCAAAIVPFLRDSESLIDGLLAVPGVVELYPSPDDLDQMVAELD